MSSQHGGYEDQSFVAELYDHVPGYVGRPDLEFYLDYVRSTPQPTLELGCGTGRLLVPIAKAGHRITGLDLSTYMLDQCRTKLQREPADVQERARIVQGDMTDFDLGEKFGLITIPFRAFQHLISVEEQLGCLRCANQHLDPGGRLILDLFQVNLRYLIEEKYRIERDDFSGVSLPGGRTLRRSSRLSDVRRLAQVNDVEMIFWVTHPDGRVERLVQAFPMRYFFYYELEHLLARAGFHIAEAFGGFDRSPLRDNSPEMLIIAQKDAQ